jgi:hypothetical protein
MPAPPGQQLHFAALGPASRLCPFRQKIRTAPGNVVSRKIKAAAKAIAAPCQSSAAAPAAP